MKIGLIINPWAGIGGQVALKGSDGEDIVKEALKRGATQTALKKTLQCLNFLQEHLKENPIQWICAKGEMGSNCLETAQFDFTPINYSTQKKTTKEDTINIAKLLIKESVDLILFAGGDGTARDLFSVVKQSTPVLGIPAGVKIHSSVYALTPQDAARCILELLENQLIEISEQEVRDINEEAFRNNQVQSKYFGQMITPNAPQFIQAVKMGGIESDELLNDEIADFIIESLEPDCIYFIGSGKTLDCLMNHLGLENTLLGVDAILNNEVIQNDLTSNDILKLMKKHPFKAILSVIGGQGHIFGRGNHQFNKDVLAKLNPSDITITSNKRKLLALENKPLIIDSLDESLKPKFNHKIKVLTGYDQWVIYPVN